MAKTKIPATLEEAFALLDAKLTADEKNELLQAEDSTDFSLRARAMDLGRLSIILG